MNCEIGIHEAFIELKQSVCPFCKQPLEDEKKCDNTDKYYFCCDRREIVIDNGQIICRNCGIIQGYKKAKEFINFYENLYRIRRKSIYHRKYHLNNILMDIGTEYNVTFSVEKKNEIMRIFSEIGKILPQINGERKRMISLNFILIQVLRMMGLPFNKIPISKSKRTLNSYQEYWEKIMILIGDIIKGIIVSD